LGRGNVQGCALLALGTLLAQADTWLLQSRYIEGSSPEMIQNYTILGRDRQDAEVQRDRWLLEHPEIRVLRLHPPRPEPPTLLTRIGGRDVPRVSIEVEYEE
jgi:hypothetical protein